VQEVFLKVFRNIGSFRGNSSLKTWIYRIAVNEAYNHRRWFSRHHRQEVALGREESVASYADSVADPAPTPFDLAADHETRALVEKALEKLNPKFRTAVVLRDIEDLSYEEIAAVLEISLGTVKSRILRGREALRKVLEGRLELETSMSWASQPLTE
jgi:RNA polymerase sigma-70 factor (ECF subfamily)